MPQPPTSVVFDFGRVLVDFDFDLAFRYWASASGRHVSEIRSKFEFEDAYRSHERGEISVSQYFQHLNRRLKVNLTDEELLIGWNSIFLDPMTGIDRLLEELRGQIPLYVFSNTNEAHFTLLSQRYADLLDLFAGVFCSHSLGIRKPNPEAFVKVAAAISVPPEALVFFDDLPENVNGAREAGLQAHVVSNVAQIRKILREEYSLTLRPL